MQKITSDVRRRNLALNAAFYETWAAGAAPPLMTVASSGAGVRQSSRPAGLAGTYRTDQTELPIQHFSLPNNQSLVVLASKERPIRTAHGDPVRTRYALLTAGRPQPTYYDRATHSPTYLLEAYNDYLNLLLCKWQQYSSYSSGTLESEIRKPLGHRFHPVPRIQRQTLGAFCLLTNRWLAGDHTGAVLEGMAITSCQWQKSNCFRAGARSLSFASRRHRFRFPDAPAW